jgi:hypothetical protein
VNEAYSLFDTGFFPGELVRQKEYPVKRLTLVLMVLKKTPEDREM